MGVNYGCWGLLLPLALTAALLALWSGNFIHTWMAIGNDREFSFLVLR